ncbi:MAG: DUF3368 domain-containing protein [Anaerolineae bacterium]|nr:DUF3368 domain-containing protein [Anaerolineae bacterium]
MTLWVADASPLIFLAKLERLDLARYGVDTVCIPEAVLAEVQAKPDMAKAAITTAVRTWLTVRKVNNPQVVELLSIDLDLGEAEVIALAKTLNAHRVLLDDLDARRFARRAGLKPVGTLGLLLAARLRGEIPSLKIEIDRLQLLGFRASPALVIAVLQEAGEL